MKKTISVCMVLLFLISGLCAAAPKKPSSKLPKTTTTKTTTRKTTSSNSSSSSSSIEESCMDALLDICCSLMIANGVGVTFEDYPYADGGGFVINDYESATDVDGKFYNLLLDTSLFMYPGSALMGNRTRAELTCFKFIGINFENIMFTNDLHQTEAHLGSMENAQGMFKLGAQFWCFQWDPISLGLNMDWLHMYGRKKYNTFAFETILRSYPFSPLHLEWRYCFSGSPRNVNYSSDDTITDELLMNSCLMVGFVMDRYELFVTWEYVQDGFEQMRSNGFGVGLRAHF